MTIYITMVCSIGSVKMAVMARLLAAGSFSQTIREDVGHQKLLAQCIHRELNEADEANLLDEEDMHVFDLKPMTDPLHLVCCNACRKPVKSSQYAAHAELCRSLSTSEELVPELDSGAGNRKPRRKERNRPVTAGNQSASIQVEETFKTSNAYDTAASAYHLGKQIGMLSSSYHLGKQIGTLSSFSLEGKDTPISANVRAIADTSVASSGKSSTSTAVAIPPTKRPKLIAADIVQPSGGIVTADSISNIISSQKAFPNVPAPLATKVYYSLRNNRLRSAISYIYHNTPESGHRCGKTSPVGSEMDMDTSQGSAPKIVPHDEFQDQSEKGYRQCPPAAQNPDQLFVQNLEAGLGGTRGHQPQNNYLNQSPANDVLTSQTAPAGMTRSRYMSQSHSFTGNSGTSLDTIQRCNGRVPVL